MFITSFQFNSIRVEERLIQFIQAHLYKTQNLRQILYIFKAQALWNFAI